MSRRSQVAQWQMPRRPARFVILFGCCFFLGFGLRFTPPVQAADIRFSRLLVKISHTVILWCGGHASLDGAVLRSPAGEFAVEMQDGCNGATVTILLCSAMLAFPAGWKKKALGLLCGGLIIQSLNIVRFVSLFYLGQYSFFWFDFAHSYLWESLLVLDTMVVFWIWASRVRPTGEIPDVAE